MHQLTLDQVAWSSPWRHRSVRDKATLALGLIVAVVALPPLPTSALVTLISLAVLLGPVGVRSRQLVRIGWIPAVSILIGVITVAVSVSADRGLRVELTPASTTQAIEVAFRATAATSSMLILACSTPVVDLFSALRRARVPDALIEIASLVYRLTATLLINAAAVQSAQVARLGYSSRPAAMRSASMAAGVLLVRSWHRAQRLEEGLAGRGYTDSLRTLDPARRRSAGFLAITWALLAALVGVAIAWEVLS